MRYAYLLLVSLLIGCNTKPDPIKWEYKIQTIPDASFGLTMDTLGLKRWELVFARRASESSTSYYSSPTFSYEVIFKRPKISEE